MYFVLFLLLFTSLPLPFIVDVFNANKSCSYCHGRDWRHGDLKKYISSVSHISYMVAFRVLAPKCKPQAVKLSPAESTTKENVQIYKGTLLLMPRSNRPLQFPSHHYQSLYQVIKALAPTVSEIFC